MPDAPFQRLSAGDRRYALRVAQDKSPHRAILLEKDVWIVATLGVLLEDEEPFDTLMERCAEIEARANNLKA